MRQATIVAREFIRVVRRATIVALPRRSLFTSINRGLTKQLKAGTTGTGSSCISLAMPSITTFLGSPILLRNYGVSMTVTASHEGKSQK